MNAAIYLLLCKLFHFFRNDLLRVTGKRGQKVPIVLTPEVSNALKLLADDNCRQHCHVANNPYMFAIPTYLSNIQGHSAINIACSHVQLDRPDLMKAMNLRRHIGTMCQVLQLNGNELEWLSRHMGHNLAVHKEFYQLHHSTIELTRVSMLLTLIDEGKAGLFANRKLSEISINGK